ncbi:GNAT family N-acetyltransferase [Chryseolinea lacunae]|uniref:GNAT family N-acetyltransferase n=1 Tax=Chryseolinea lacunae TaxID=2801331 RepID=A0ABS1L2A4_9BACT|nr:GNAT family N-acetyltransferase [Chryseolinea lacunae]MBL0745647.1 GNAT family N-acetyltransferase [Chryseolinea lacunae]
MTNDITLTTNRLLLQPLSEQNSELIHTLVNTDGWFRFIGNRNVNSNADAITYIQNIMANTTTIYWTVTLKETQTAIGVVTLIKRTYLEHTDIGFAFLPEFFNKGYAYEATHKILTHLLHNNLATHILAVTLPDNSSSIRLIEKLGLKFEREMESNNEVLHVYKISKTT